MSAIEYKKPRLSRMVWGLSAAWFAVCPWNGEEFWVQIPFVALIVGTKHVELALGYRKWALNIDVRWRWD